MQRRHRITSIVALAAVTALFVGCSGDDTETSAPKERRLDDFALASSLRRFDSCEALRTWARDELAPRVGAYGFPGGWYGPGMPTPLAAEGDMVQRSSGDDSAGAAEQASGPRRRARTFPAPTCRSRGSTSPTS